MNILMQGNILLALAAALMWGGGDFSGGMGVKTLGGSVRGALRIVLLSHVTSFVVLLAIVSLRGMPAPHGVAVIWGIAGGAVAGISVTAFYMALARGAMGVPAAVSGLLAAAIPAAVSIAANGSPGAMKLGGFLVAGGAIWLIAAGADEAGNDATIESSGTGVMGLAVFSGAGFGVYFVALKMAGTAGPVWAMGTARIGSMAACMLLLLFWPKKKEQTVGRIGPKVLFWVLLTAVLDTGGNLFFVAATRAGRLDVASVLASLYPASTILLAALTLHEQLTRRQGLGMAVATVAVVMITL